VFPGVKLATHVVVGAGVAIFASTHLGCGLPLVAVAGAAGTMIQYLVDMLGHERVGAVPRRTEATHSPEGATFLSLLVWVAAVAVSYQAGWGLSPACALALGPAVWLAAMSHLALDLVTEGGVYASLRSRRRVRILGLPYDDPLLNGATQLIGAALIVASMAKLGLIPLR
jgi:membrane-bound metal-dependent hydrolase YbcI (DUF457 family)